MSDEYIISNVREFALGLLACIREITRVEIEATEAGNGDGNTGTIDMKFIELSDGMRVEVNLVDDAGFTSLALAMNNWVRGSGGRWVYNVMRDMEEAESE